MFVSNSDNLGATLDLKILMYFASLKILMYFAQRTEGDKKGRHLAKNVKTGTLTLEDVKEGRQRHALQKLLLLPLCQLPLQQ